MQRFKSLFFSLFLISSAISVFADKLPDKVTIERTLPQWVEAVEADYNHPVPDSGSADGVYYLLSDQQVLPKEGLNYKHYALRLISADGVEDYSSVSVNIDPDYQTLIWHRLDIIRDGVRIDQLDNQAFRSSTNQNSDDLIYDNSLECLAIIQDTKKGDILDYAYTVSGRNPITDGRYARSFSLNYSVPIAHIFGRLVSAPGERLFHFKLISNDSLDLEIPQPTQSNGKLEYRFERRDVEAIQIDQDIPGSYDAYSRFHVSDWKSWQEVSKWGTSLYDYENIELTLPPELKTAQAKWLQLDNDKAKTLAALKWVQEEIRYVAIFIGPHNYKPYTIQETLDRGFGDCKDKTQLLCYLLSQMKIDAIPTLVSTINKGQISQSLPAASLFNHVITEIRIDGQSYWLDPTNSSQGGPIDTLWHRNYELGLNLTANTNALTAVPGQGAEENQSFIRETLSMEDYNEDINFTVYSRYTGSKADSMRRYVERTIPAEIEKSYINFYAKQYSDIQSAGSMEFKDDPARNIYEVTEYYTISNAWVPEEHDPATSDLATKPKQIRSSIYLSDTRIRTMPAAQSYPLDLTEVIEIILPTEGTFPEEDTVIETQWFKYTYSVKTEGNKLILSYNYKNLTPTIPAEDYPEYARQLEEVYDTLTYSITYTDNDLQQTTEPQITNGSHKPHLATYLSVVLALTLAIIASAWIVTRQKTPPLPPIDVNQDGIRGWLVLPSIGVLIMPIVSLIEIIGRTDYFSSPWVGNYATVDNEYSAGLEGLLLFDLSYHIFLLSLSFTLIYVFFKKRAVTRWLYILLAIVTALFPFVDYTITNYLYTANGYDPIELDTQGIGMVVKAFIWGTYFSISDRARSTFRH